MTKFPTAPGRKFVNRAGETVLEEDFGTGPRTFHLTDRTTGATITIGEEHLAFLVRDAKIPMSVEDDVLDVAAERAFEASHMVNGTQGTHRDFKVQIVEWRGIAKAAIAAALPIQSQLLPTDAGRVAFLDETLGLSADATAEDRYRAIIEPKEELDAAEIVRRERLRPIAEYLKANAGRTLTLSGWDAHLQFDRALIMHSETELVFGIDGKLTDEIPDAQEDEEVTSSPVSGFIDYDTVDLSESDAVDVDAMPKSVFKDKRSIILIKDSADLDLGLDLESVKSTSVAPNGALHIDMTTGPIVIDVARPIN
jgi:hypothetical protein